MLKDALAALDMEIVASDRDTVTLMRADVGELLRVIQEREHSINRLVAAATTTSPLMYEVVNATMMMPQFMEYSSGPKGLTDDDDEQDEQDSDGAGDGSDAGDGDASDDASDASDDAGAPA